MKLIELDSHPLIGEFRKQASNFVNISNEMYHLLLPPEYNIPAHLMAPLLYLFVEKREEPGVLRQYGGGEHVLRLIDGHLEPQTGFQDGQPCKVLQTTPWTTTSGFTFDVHEIFFNVFMPSAIPPLCDEIQEGYTNPGQALLFLKQRIRSQQLPAVLAELEASAAKDAVTVETRDAVVAKMHTFMDRISDIVFEVKPFHFIPTLYKMRVNYIVFYAVANLFNTKLVEAFDASLKGDNDVAKKAVGNRVQSSADPKQLDEAAVYLEVLAGRASIADAIGAVSKFFEGVVKALSDKNAAADDILPAVCDGMSRCRAISGRLVSTFQYLADLWPIEGLEERTTYILTTCAIAVSHFAYNSSAQVPAMGPHKM